VRKFASNRNNRLGGKIGVRLIFVGLLAGPHLGLSARDPEDSRTIVREQITDLQAAVPIDYKCLK
jgi:hypothetical protein